MNIEDLKKLVGRSAAQLVKNDMIIGLGTGSTVYWLIEELSLRVRGGLNLQVVPTSQQTSLLAKERMITVISLDDVEQIQLTIDGADEIDPAGLLIKGGGGALLQEKIVAAASKELVIIADGSKLVDRLGRFPLPVEVIPFGYKQVQRKISDRYKCKVSLRKIDDHPFVSDHGHYILDCSMNIIEDALQMNEWLLAIPGVVETGLFIGMANRSMIGYEDGRIETFRY